MTRAGETQWMTVAQTEHSARNTSPRDAINTARDDHANGRAKQRQGIL